MYICVRVCVCVCVVWIWRQCHNKHVCGWSCCGGSYGCRRRRRRRRRSQNIVAVVKIWSKNRSPESWQWRPSDVQEGYCQHFVTFRWDLIYFNIFNFAALLSREWVDVFRQFCSHSNHLLAWLLEIFDINFSEGLGVWIRQKCSNY